MEAEPSMMEENGQELSEKEQRVLLQSRIEGIKSSNAALLAENDMLESFISRLHPHDLASPAGADASGPAAAASPLESTGCRRRRRSRNSISDRPQQLTSEQKLYVAQREVTETQRDHENLKLRYETIQDNYKASLKESEMRLAEIRKAKKEFERRLLKPMKDDKLEMKEPEKVLQYIRDKSKVTQSEKLNLKNLSLKMQEKKLQQQLHLKKELGRAEYEENFQENIQDYNEQRADNNLDELQVNVSKVQRILNSHKEQLQSVTLQSTELSSDIANRKQTLEKMEKEIQRAQREHLKAEAQNQHLRHQLADYQAPEITEYMGLKDRHKKLQQSIRTCQRKVGIAEMTSKGGAEARRKQRATVTPADGAAAGARSGRERLPVKFPAISEHPAEKRRTSRPTEAIQE